MKPGETLQLKVGGMGRPVIGKFVLPADSNLPAGLTMGLLPSILWGRGCSRSTPIRMRDPTDSK